MKNVYFAGLLGVVLINMSYADTTSQNIRLTGQQQSIDISLPANGTTGYQWFLQNYDHDLLILQGYRYVAKSAPKGMTGVGGTATFTFSVDPRFYDGPQITEVNFVYEQPWNPGQNVSSTQVTVSSTASSNDDEDWQKYPQMLGPGAGSTNASLYNDGNQVQAQINSADATADSSALVVSPSGAVQSSAGMSATPAPVKKAVPSTSMAAPANVGMPADASVPDMQMAYPDTSGPSASLPVSGSQDQWLSLPSTTQNIPATNQAKMSVPALPNTAPAGQGGAANPAMMSTPTATTPTGSAAAASGASASDPTANDVTTWLSIPAAPASTTTSTSSSTTK